MEKGNMKKERIRERDSSLDVIRIFAVFSVIAVHFFLNSEFYSQPVTGNAMYGIVFVRSFFMVCVPLFLLLTGYLMSRKTLSKKYYLGIVKTLGIYVLASIACILYKNIKVPGTYDVKEAVLGILDFSAANYSWYIEMYIGLFLLIPFLNLMYHGLKNKKQKLALIVTLLFLTSVPEIINIFNFSVEEWWLQPSISAEYRKLIPSFWVAIYPLTYYFIGSYLKEFGLSVNKLFSWLFLLSALLFIGSFNYYRSFGGAFVWGPWQNWDSLFHVVLAVLVFHIIVETQWIKKLPSGVKTVLKWLSDLSLGAYLVSYIFDSEFYPVLKEHIPLFTGRFRYFPVIVLAVFLCSMLLSAVLNLIYKGLYLITKMAVKRVKG